MTTKLNFPVFILWLAVIFIMSSCATNSVEKKADSSSTSDKQNSEKQQPVAALKKMQNQEIEEERRIRRGSTRPEPKSRKINNNESKAVSDLLAQLSKEANHKLHERAKSSKPILANPEYIGKSRSSIGNKKKHKKKEQSRSWLLSGKEEGDGYGLYSYLIINRTSNRSRRIAYAVIKSLMGIEETKVVEQSFAKKNINVIYIPVRRTPNNTVPSLTLANYDYQRARLLIKKIEDIKDESLQDGPYLVSTLSKLSKVEPKIFLFQDLSKIDPRLAKVYVKEFKRTTAKCDFWNERKLYKCLLSLRNILTQLAKPFQDTRKGVTELAQWTDSVITIIDKTSDKQDTKKASPEQGG